MNGTPDKQNFWDVERFEKAGKSAMDCDELVSAAYWLILADLRGTRPKSDLIAECTNRWLELNRPLQHELIDGEFTRHQHEFGLATLFFFSHTNPGYAMDWFHQASIAGDIDARMFSLKFFGGFPATSERIRDYDSRGNLIAALMVLMALGIILLVVLIVIVLRSGSGIY